MKPVHYTAVLLCLLACAARAQDLPVIPIASLEYLRLGAPAEYLETPNGLELAELHSRGLAAGFRPLLAEEADQGLSDSAFWLRVRLRNDGPSPVTWILHDDTSWLDYLTLYVTDSGGTPQTVALSDRQPFAGRPVDYRKLALRHTTPAEGYSDLYLRLQFLDDHADAVNLNLHLWEEQAFYHHQAGENLFYGLFYGCSLTLMLISFILAAMMRRGVYLWYGLFLAATNLFWLALNGFGYQYVWPTAVWWHNEGFHLIFLAFCMLAVQFSRVFLNTRRLLPRIDLVLRGMLLFGACGILLRLLGLYETVMLMAALFIASLVFLPVLGWLAWRRGVTQAFWYMLAWSVYGLALLFGLLSAYTDLLPWGLEPLLFTQAGSLLENFLLLYATGKRVAQLERERRQAITMANTDVLTDLGNRRVLARHYEALRTRFEQSGEPVYLILMDVDRFKRINDRYGHEAGDRVLVELAHMLADASRASDACVRYGGEEFALLVQVEDREAALQIGERIRRRFEACPTRYHGQSIPHTLSVGLTAVFEGERRLDEREMIRRADEALYEAKARGRNCTIILDGDELSPAWSGA